MDTALSLTVSELTMSFMLRSTVRSSSEEHREGRRTAVREGSASSGHLGPTGDDGRRTRTDGELSGRASETQAGIIGAETGRGKNPAILGGLVSGFSTQKVQKVIQNYIT